ncbi:MAG: SpoIIE family protein phosphatase [Bryobacterales bacterium]|nr:SpoIIE family protein phosphatase [Bryobacterales bacterium]
MTEFVETEILLIGPDGAPRPIRLNASPFIMGRSETVNLPMPGDTMLSRQHCAFEWTAGAWVIRDLGSKNGTTVNGQPLVREHRLFSGDRIVAGRQVLEFEVNKGTLPKPAPSPLEFVEDDAGVPMRPDSTFIIRLDSANFSSKPSGALSVELERANRRMDALVRAGRELASFKPIESLFGITLDLALDAVGAKRGVLMTLENGELITRANKGDGFRVSSAVRDKVMRERASLLVQDASADSLLRASQTIVQQNIKSLMAVPLQTESQVIGILYVDTPSLLHPFDAEALSLLTVFANIAAIRIEHARLVEVEHAERLMMHDLEQAADIQRNLFPQNPPQLPGLELSGRSLPCRSVGGDYFDYIPMADGRILVVVADVSGKGLAASLLMSSLQARVHALCELETDVAKLVSRLNHSIKANTPDNKFITGFFAAIHPDTGEMEYSNAGHNAPVIARQSGKTELLTAGGPVLGILPNITYAGGRTRLDRGDLLVMYSDGVSEAPNAKGDEFGEEPVAQIAAACIDRSADEVLMEIARQLRAFLGDCSPTDDVTMVVARKR